MINEIETPANEIHEILKMIIGSLPIIRFSTNAK